MTEGSQLFQSSGHVAGDRWTGKDGVIPVSGFNPVVVLGYQQPTTYPPTESPAQGPFLPSAERTSCMYPPGMKNGDVDLPASPSGTFPSSTVSPDQYSLPTTQRQWTWQELQPEPLYESGSYVAYVQDQGSTSVTMQLEAAGGYHVAERQSRRDRQRLLSESQEPSFPLYNSQSGLAGARDTRQHFSNLPASGDGGSQDQFQAPNEPVITAPHSLHQNQNHLGLGPYPTAEYTVPTSGRPLSGSTSDYHNTYTEDRHREFQPQDALPFHAESEGTRGVDSSRNAGRQHSLAGQTLGNRVSLRAVPLSPFRAGMPDQSTEVRYPKRAGRKKQAAVKDKATPGKKRASVEKAREFRLFIAQLRTTSLVIRVPTHFIKVPQKTYRCPANQGDWEDARIEFHGIMLTDAINPNYTGLCGYGDHVLQYEGVGTTVSCRIINLAGREIARLKILTKNGKDSQVPITRGKLAFEMAKLAWRSLGDIKKQDDCADITFESLALVRLIRVARASWQPVLWYAAAPEA